MASGFCGCFHTWRQKFSTIATLSMAVSGATILQQQMASLSAPDVADVMAVIRDVSLVPRTRSSHDFAANGARIARLLDDFVSGYKEGLGHGQAECLGGLEVDDQLVLERGLDGKLARLIALQDAIGIGRRAPMLINKIRSVRDQAAAFSE